jgi:SAM-dependent methyltransferase
MLRSGFDARLATSYTQRTRPREKPLSILDAGCGRGVGLLTAATLHPEARLVGADLCRTALDELRGQVRERGLANVELCEVDLMSLEGLPVPEGGFDLVYSSGVVHHLCDPALGLRKLAEVLAPTGTLVLMVYGKIGRRGIKRVMRALKAWVDPEAPLREQLACARLLVEELADETSPDCPWRAAAVAPDAEFVDRYLHPNETDFDVPRLFDLLEGAGLRFLRWMHPEHWSLESHMPPGALRDTVEALPERERYTVIEQIARPQNLQLLCCKPDNSPRRLPPLEQWGELLFAAHPEVSFQLGSRNLWKQTRVESLHYSLRGGEPQLLPPGNLQKAAFILANQNEPFRGTTLIQALVQDGVLPTEALPTLRALVEHELVYTPHEVELP